MTTSNDKQAFEQPADFLQVSEQTYALLANLGDEDFKRSTRFKNWTIDEIVAHLHVWNWAAEQVLVDVSVFQRFVADFLALKDPTGLRRYERSWLGPLHGQALLKAWREQYVKTAERFQTVDPKMRTKWVGPDMSARSNISARLMETWAHSQAIFDLLGVQRIDTDRIRNVAVMGINTFDWTFINRKQPVPGVRPYIRLTAPSGAIWTWNDESEIDRIEGSATQFCQVVAQTRNITDTNLKVLGDSATSWMSIAQCFAGVPQPPPAPGTRFMEPKAVG